MDFWGLRVRNGTMRPMFDICVNHLSTRQKITTHPLAPSLLRKEGNPHPSELPLFFPKRGGWGVSEAKSIIFCRVLM